MSEEFATMACFAGGAVAIGVWALLQIAAAQASARSKRALSQISRLVQEKK